MSKELKAGEKVPRAIRHIAKEELDGAIEQLAGRKPAREGEAIHEARKNLKKVRALLRLVRDGLGRKAYRREGRRFRAAGKAMARQRDAQVLIKTLDKLRKRHRGPEARAVLLKMERATRERCELLLRQWRGREKKLRAELRSARHDIGEWPLERLKWADLCRGATRTYREGAAAFGEAGQTRDAQDLHVWRKRVKDSWHQLQVIMPVRPKALGGLTRRMERLGERLGDDHDLAMLEQAALTAGLKYWELERLSGWLHSEREKLQNEAFELGRRIYAKKPAAFERRMKHYAKKWRRG